MAYVYPHTHIGDSITPLPEANLSIASSAVLYGLSVYTVFHVAKTDNDLWAFRLPDHFQRLCNSAKIIGIDTFEQEWDYEKFLKAVKKLIEVNGVHKDVFVRASVHVDALVPGTRSRGLSSTLSMFVYDAEPILPQSGARLKTSLWRRIPDNAIPSRAKVNGAYVNSVLARQDAIDSGYDDCVFLDSLGHVCELSAANIFIVRDGHIITPDTHSDLLEGINRRSMVQIARDGGYDMVERQVDLTELYIADEVFVTGTSAFVARVSEIDARTVGDGKIGPITEALQKIYRPALHGSSKLYKEWTINVGKVS